MATSYEDLYSRCLGKIEDYGLAVFSEEDLENTMHGWLTSAIAKMSMRNCSSDLTKRDDEEKTFSIDLLDVEKEVLALYMVIEWLNPQINSMSLTRQFIGGKEEKYYAQANHLSELKSLREETEVEAQKLMRDYTFRSDSDYFN